MATYLDRQERLFFWYRNRARKDYYVQGWKRGRIYADFVVTLRPDEPETDDAFHRVYVLETKGMHLKHAADTEYKRSVFDLCSEHARRKDWAEFVPGHARQGDALQGRRRGRVAATVECGAGRVGALVLICLSIIPDAGYRLTSRLGNGRDRGEPTGVCGWT